MSAVPATTASTRKQRQLDMQRPARARPERRAVVALGLAGELDDGEIERRADDGIGEQHQRHRIGEAAIVVGAEDAHQHQVERHEEDAPPPAFGTASRAKRPACLRMPRQPAPSIMRRACRRAWPPA